MTARQGLLGAFGALTILSMTLAAPLPAGAEEERDSSQTASAGEIDEGRRYPARLRPGDTTVEIGLLLPAVQSARE